VRGRWRWTGRIGALLFLSFVALQLVPVRRTNPPVESDVAAPAEVKDLLRRACYDCHSHETRWPWYARVAPVSWWIADDVEHARIELNFSRWPNHDPDEQRASLSDIRKQVSRGWMPLRSYKLLHPRARLDAAEREALLRWAGGR
jgi:hypothetical protein